MKRMVNEHFSLAQSHSRRSRGDTGNQRFQCFRAGFAYFVLISGTEGKQGNSHAQHKRREKRTDAFRRLRRAGHARPALASGGFRRQRLFAGQAEDEGVCRHQLQEGNCAAEVREERSEGANLVRVCGSKSRRSVVQLAGDVVRALPETRAVACKKRTDGPASQKVRWVTAYEPKEARQKELWCGLAGRSAQR